MGGRTRHGDIKPIANLVIGEEPSAPHVSVAHLFLHLCHRALEQLDATSDQRLASRVARKDIRKLKCTRKRQAKIHYQ
jgi:hypothetical protein